MAMRVDKTKPTQTIAGTTGQQMAPVGLLGEPMAKTIGDAGIEVGAALSEADQRIVKRNDAIKSITANDDFNRKINDEYNSLSETSDMKDPEVLRKFNSFVRREQALALNNFAGTSQEAKSRFEEAILNQSLKYESTAIARHREDQISFIKTQFGDEYAPILEGVSTGNFSAQQGFDKLRAAMEAKEDLLPYRDRVAMFEAAEEEIALAAVNKYLDGGEWEKASQEMDMMPQFAQKVGSKNLMNIAKRINSQKSIEEGKRIEARVKQRTFATAQGVKSFDELSPALKVAFYTGKMPEQPAPLTPAGKTAFDRRLIAEQVKNGSMPEQALVDFDLAQRNLNNVVSKSPRVALMQELQNRETSIAAAGDDPNTDEIVQTLRSEVEASDPEVIRLKKLNDDFAPARVALQGSINMAEDLARNAMDALSYIVGGDATALAGIKLFDENGKKVNFQDDPRYKALKDKVEKADIEFGEIELMFGQFAGGSDVMEAAGAMEAVKSNQFVETMSKNDFNLGVMSDSDIRLVTSLAGALDVDSPLTSAKAMLKILERVQPSIIDRQTTFEKTYKELLEVQKPSTNNGTSNQATESTNNSARSAVNLEEFDSNGT